MIDGAGSVVIGIILDVMSFVSFVAAAVASFLSALGVVPISTPIALVLIGSFIAGVFRMSVK